MATSHTDSRNELDTKEPSTQQQQQKQRHQLMHSPFAHGPLLQQAQTQTERHLDTSTNDLSITDDYGVKSMDDFLPCFKPGDINMSSPATAASSPLLHSFDNSSEYNSSTSTFTSSHPISYTIDKQQQQQQQQTNHGVSKSTVATATAAKEKDDNSSNTSDRTADRDDTISSSNNTSGYDDSLYDEDDTFSTLTGDVSQPCFYGHANDSTATWQSNVSDSNIDLVVPKMNIRHGGKQPSNDMMTMTSYQNPLGQSIGYLSIMVCGDSGIGKTALIRAFTLMSEIIGGKLYTRSEANGLDQDDDDDDGEAARFGNGENKVVDISSTEKSISGEIKEYYASTMKSIQWNPSQKQVDALDKNICFIDTPGYGAFVDAKAVIRSTTNYLERQFQLTNDILAPTQASTPKVARLLHNSHGGHSHVDVCLYLILDRIKPVDIEYLRSIQQLCNIIPVIVKTDLLSYDQEQALKRQVLEELDANKIDFYQCGYSYEQLLAFCQKDEEDTTDVPSPPFSVSTKPLTNKHYQKPRSTNGYLKLIQLKDILFYKHVDRLRQSTVTKFIHWRREQTNIMQAYRSQQQQQQQQQKRRHHSASSKSTTSSSTSSSYTTVVAPYLSSSSSSINYNKQQNNDQHQQSRLTTMVDLESMTQKLAVREIAERIQELSSKQRRTINLHMVNYVNEQRQRLEQQKQERLFQLQRKYQLMTQQEKVKFLTTQLNGLLTEFGLLKPGESGGGSVLSQQPKVAESLSSSSCIMMTATTTTTTSTTNGSSSVWHIYPPPDVINYGLIILQSPRVYWLGGTMLVAIFISGILKWWWTL